MTCARWSPTSRRYSFAPRREAGEVADRVGRGLEAVALLAHQPVVLAHLLPQPVDPRELLAAGALEHLALERVDLGLDRVDHRVPGVGQRVEDPVDEVVLGLGALREQRVVEVVEQVALLLADREDEVAGDVDVDLERDRDRRPVGAVDARGVEDDQDVRLVDVDLRALAELARVLHRHRVQAEHARRRARTPRRRARAGRARRTRRAPARSAMRCSSTSVRTSMSAWEPTWRKVCSAEPKSRARPPVAFGGNER